MNGFFEQHGREKATYTYVWTEGTRGPWTTYIFAELDLCLVRNISHNSITDVKADPNTNATTDHTMLTVRIEEQLKPEDKGTSPKSLKRQG
eukprot:2506591-Heterocapsa_arctica.AAC.1